MKLLYWILFIVMALGGSACQNNRPGTFAVGDKTFLLNDRPFVVKAAEIHYPRIPHEYWEHRIEMCKALGMNTICIYVFWNIHEQQERHFDFTGQNDIAEFCRLAQKHNMWVIVRPGPYVCAEWEMGGLPWWLLQNDSVKLRTTDPYFMKYVARYMDKVGKELAGLQITKGGNIIMVQVENEYGAYAVDKEYVKQIRDMVRKAGFTEVPLFQCDWNSNFQANALDDLLWTINFGTGANVGKQFENLRQLRPNIPLMCSEFWSGWFDHWGRPHETRSADALVGGMKEMLDNGISFSLYMAHGGTTFGHWGGANSPAYSAMCSSYDYDAPINEAGQTTDKFFAVRELLGKYLPEGEQLAEIPEALPMIEIPSFTLNQTALLFENLPLGKKSADPKPMEKFGQGWGTILYRTRIPASSTKRNLVITDVHDWAQVFVDGRKAGTLDRRRSEQSIVLPPCGEEATLDILVEAMGRVNFGKTIHDRKGITEKVELYTGLSGEELKNWEVFSFPPDWDFAAGRSFNKSGKWNTPAYYRGTFELSATGDVFLDMQRWGKGMVWVNGYALGRFWKLGPQQTLFLPGCWLKKGENEIIILDLEGPEENVVLGRKTPVLDVLRPDNSLCHRQKGQQLRLENERPVFSGSFHAGNGWQEIQFGKSQQARYFCLEALNSHGGDGFSSIAELEVLGVGGHPVSREDWKIVYADSEEVNAANNAADKIFDLQESTFWHTAYSVEKPGHPHHIVIDLGKVNKVTGFRYLPRPEAKLPGMVKDFRIYVKINEFQF